MCAIVANSLLAAAVVARRGDVVSSFPWRQFADACCLRAVAGLHGDRIER
jgi:hypothetical protein